MFGRNKKPEPEQGREGRQVARQGGAPSPAFSYYTNRAPELNAERRMVRQERVERPETGERKPGSRSRLAQIPLWLLIGVFAVCLFRVLALGTNPKVIVVGKSSTAANYLQSSDVYAAAGHKQLAGSILNRSKLTVNLDGTAAALKKRFPELQSVSLDIPLVGTRPILYVQIAQPSLVAQTPSGDYALNANGVVLAKLRSIPSGVPVVVDQSGARPTSGKQFLPGGTVAYVQAVAYQFDAAHMPISTFILPTDAPYELDVRLSGQQYRIRMNLMADSRVQSGAAIATVQKLGSSVPAEYLDVRTPDRIYYK